MFTPLRRGFIRSFETWLLNSHQVLRKLSSGWWTISTVFGMGWSCSLETWVLSSHQVLRKLSSGWWTISTVLGPMRTLKADTHDACWCMFSKVFGLIRALKIGTHDACRVASPRRKFRKTCKRKHKTPNPRILFRQRGVNSRVSRYT